MQGRPGVAFCYSRNQSVGKCKSLNPGQQRCFYEYLMQGIVYNQHLSKEFNSRYQKYKYPWIKKKRGQEEKLYCTY